MGVACDLHAVTGVAVVLARRKYRGVLHELESLAGIHVIPEADGIGYPSTRVTVLLYFRIAAVTLGLGTCTTYATGRGGARIPATVTDGSTLATCALGGELIVEGLLGMLDPPVFTVGGEVEFDRLWIISIARFRADLVIKSISIFLGGNAPFGCGGIYADPDYGVPVKVFGVPDLDLAYHVLPGIVASLVVNGKGELGTNMYRQHENEQGR
jgi:hypothetical protein